MTHWRPDIHLPMRRLPVPAAFHNVVAALTFGGEVLVALRGLTRGRPLQRLAQWQRLLVQAKIGRAHV